MILKWTSGSTVTRLLEGVATVTPEGHKMSNVTVTDTTYNITVAETDTSVTVSSGDAITVLVDTFTPTNVE